MVTLKDEISSQENMEQWMSQLGHPENPISNKGVLVAAAAAVCFLRF